MSSNEIINKVQQSRLPENNVVDMDTSKFNWYWFGGFVSKKDQVKVTFYPCKIHQAIMNQLG